MFSFSGVGHFCSLEKWVLQNLTIGERAAAHFTAHFASAISLTILPLLSRTIHNFWRIWFQNSQHKFRPHCVLFHRLRRLRRSYLLNNVAWDVMGWKVRAMMNWILNYAWMRGNWPCKSEREIDAQKHINCMGECLPTRTPYQALSIRCSCK